MCNVEMKVKDSHIEELQDALEKNVGKLQEKYQKVKEVEQEEVA